MNRRAPRYEHYMYSYPHKTAYRPLATPVDLATCLQGYDGQKASLYFHIPFCRHKCGYCNLFSQQGCNSSRMQEYVDTLMRQARQLSKLTSGLRFDSFAIGGGTPLLLTRAQLEQLFEAAAWFDVLPDEVFTSVETSPDYADADVLSLLKDKGVQRVSIGVQSFQPDELQAIKRRTPVATIEQALERIRQMDFPRFNIDLIYGVEEQTVDSFIASLRQALQYQPDELFIYPLYVRKGVGITLRLDGERMYDMYRAGRDELARQGYRQTSMRRFVKGDAMDLEYTCGDEWMISCGCGGRSYVGNLHFATPFAVEQSHIRQIIDQYMQTEDFTTVHEGFLLLKEEQLRRYIIKNLLYCRGIEKADYERRFGELTATFSFDSLINDGLAEDADGFLRLTPEGLAFSDDIGPLFISPEVRRRMTE